MNARTVAHVLDQAAAVIRRNGWHQGALYRATGAPKEDCPVCAYGALNLASSGRDPSYFNPIGEAAMDALERYLSAQNVKRAADWNDAPGRTVDEVLAALEGAAQAERERVAEPA